MPSPSIEAWYRERLDSLCRAMFAAEEAGASPYRIRKIFEEKAESLSLAFARENLEHSSASTSRSLRRVNVSKAPKDSRSVRAQELRIANENKRLILSIPEVYFEKMDKAKRDFKGDSFGYERRVADIRRITYNRMRLIAHDQSNKATESLSIKRLEDAGVHFVMWKHSHLSVVPREYHKMKWDGHSGIRNGKPNGLNGFIFRTDNPPVIDKKTGERGFPAQLINCKCYLVPVKLKKGS